MFWKRKTTAKWTLIYFGLIAVGIIVSSVILIIIFVKKTNNYNIQIKNNNSAQAFLGSEEVSKNYLTFWQTWQTTWASSTEQTKYLNSFDNALQTAKVPVEKLDNHMKVWLEWLKQKNTLRQESLEVGQNQINLWVASLVQ